MSRNERAEFTPCCNPVCDNQRVFRLLNLALSDEGEWKEAAEQGMQRLEASEEYPFHLTRFILDPSWHKDDRIFACKKLKEFIEAHWCEADEHFVAPEVNLRNKTNIKDLLLTGLSQTEIEVRRAVADTISTIAQWDWPQDWPELFHTLVSCLNGEDEFGVNGALLVLKKFVADQTDEQLDVAEIILREMNRIFAGESYSPEIRSLACDVFYNEVRVTAKQRRPDVIRSHLKPAVVLFCKTSMQTWTSKSCSEKLKIGILDALAVWMRCVPKYISAFLADILPLVSESLIDCAKEYRAYVVNEVDIAAEMVNHSDDLVTATVKFTKQLMNGDRGYESNINDYRLSNDEWLHLQDSLSTPSVLRHLIMLMEVTEKQIQLWDTHFDHFVVKADELGFEIDPIRRMVQVIITNAQRHNSSVAESIITLVMNYLEEENERRRNGSSGNSRNSWKSHEAFLLAFSLMRYHITSKKIGISPLYDVVLADLNNSESHPLLVVRCLSVGAIYSKDMPSEAASAFLEATVNGLQGNQPPCVKICAANAVHMWYDSINTGNSHNRSMLLSHIPAIFELLLTLAKDIKSPGVYKLLTKGVVSLLRGDKALIVSEANRIYSLMETALFDYHVGNSLRIWKVVFEKFMENRECIALLKTSLTRTLLSVMTSTPFDESRGRVALDIMLVVVRSSVRPLKDFLIDPLFPTVCNYIVSNDDCWTILPLGIDLIQRYLSVASQRVFSYEDSDGKKGAQYILQVCIYALNHKSHATKIEKICEILIVLMQEAWYEVREGIDDLLKPLLNHTQKEGSARVLPQLLMVYAHLMHRGSDTVFNFLASTMDFEEQKIFLDSVIAKGFCKEYYSIDAEQRKTMKLALGKVLEHGVANRSSPLHQITLGGYRQPIPLLVKICRLTINDQPSD